MIDYTGTFVAELRAAAAAWPAPLTNYRIDPGELAPESIPDSGKAPQAIVVRPEHPIRRRRHPVATYPFEVTIYHPDKRIVSQLAGLVSDAFHDRGPRIRETNLGKVGAWTSADVGGSGSLTEPDTKWPVQRVRVQVIGPTNVVP